MVALIHNHSFGLKLWRVVGVVLMEAFDKERCHSRQGRQNRAVGAASQKTY